jgi:hypothetical protein
MRTVLVAALLALTMLAGCSGGAADLTAMEARPAADAAADAWESDAALVGVASFEIGDDIKAMIRDEIEQARQSGEFEEEEMSGEDWAMMEAMLSSHDSPGDGEALFWAYVYTSQERQAMFAVLADASGVSFAEEVPMGWDGETIEDYGEDFQPIADWNVDSDEAAAIAAGADEEYAQLRGDPDVMALTALGMADGTPYWVLMIFSMGFGEPQAEASTGSQQDEDYEDYADEAGDYAEDFRGAFVIVNAENGSVQSFDGFDAFDGSYSVDPDVPEMDEEDFLFMEYGSASGELSVLAPTDEQVFTIEQAEHEALAIAVEASNPLLAPVEVIVTDPEGTQTTFQVAFDPAGLDSRETIVLDIVPQGDWTVSLALEPAVRNTYTVEWCSDGIGIPTGMFGATPEVCDEVDQSRQGGISMPAGRGVRDFLLELAA